MASLPKGYRIDRDASRLDGSFAREVVFRVIETDGGDEEVAAPRVALSVRDGWWWIHPGPQSSKIEADEARARAAALIMAADEQDTLNLRGGDANG